MGMIAITMFLGISCSRPTWAVWSRARSDDGRPGRDRGPRNSSVGLLRRPGVHRADPRSGCEHGVSGLSSPRADPGAGPLCAAAIINRGDRLVFSNGVLVLGLLSCLMIYAFDAELGTLINFYVVGVFTSFTLSQTGMVRHWLAEGRKGSSAFPHWRRLDRDQRDRRPDDLRRPDRRDHLQGAGRRLALDPDRWRRSFRCS